MPMSLIFNNLFISWVRWLLHVDINLVEFCPNGVSLGYSFLIADYTHGTLWPSVANFIGRTGVHSNIKGLDVFNIAIKLSNTTWFGRCAAVVDNCSTSHHKSHRTRRTVNSRHAWIGSSGLKSDCLPEDSVLFWRAAILTILF